MALLRVSTALGEGWQPAYRTIRNRLTGNP